MKQNRWLLLACLPVWLGACTHADDAGTEAGGAEQPAENPLPVQVEVVPENIGKMTLFVQPTNGGKRQVRILERMEGEWKPALQWDEISAGAVRFSAFGAEVPEDADRETFLHAVRTDQQEETAGRESDLLFASATAERGETVKLKFTSRMARLSMALQSSDGSYTDAQLAAATVSVRCHTAVSVRKMDGVVEELQPEVEEVTPFRGENAVYVAVVCPQKVDEFRENWITVNVGGDEHVFGAPDAVDGNPFEAMQTGGETTLTLDVKAAPQPEPEPKPEPTPEWANRTAWVYGVKQPAEADWGYVSDTWQRALSWQKGCGWYDCNKINVAGDPDGNLCWAAAASNMIYWWLEQNAQNVSRYGKYTGPTAYASSTDCAVFGYFKRYFKNEGGQTLFGLNWFFSGRSLKPGSGNLFPDVFDTVGDGMGFVTADDFNARLKQAFSGKEAISFCVRMMGAYHEMSIWGADFDADGRISAIYITDSNDLSQEEVTPSVSADGRRFIPVGMVRHPVAYKVSASDSGHTMVYMEGSQEGNFTIKIEELHFLGLMEEAWQKYFASHAD